MTQHRVTPAWARDFNNQPRHCNEGNGRRWRFGSWGGQVECTMDHDPKLAGTVEWLRFIREFGHVIPAANPFTSEDGRHFLLNEVDGHPTSDGRHTYCETYLFKKGDSWGLDPRFRVFLDNEAGWARIECYDEDIVGACEQALMLVERSYVPT